MHLDYKLISNLNSTESLSIPFLIWAKLFIICCLNIFLLYLKFFLPNLQCWLVIHNWMTPNSWSMSWIKPMACSNLSENWERSFKKLHHLVEFYLCSFNLCTWDTFWIMGTCFLFCALFSMEWFIISANINAGSRHDLNVTC